MTGWPIVDREPVRLPTLPGHDDEVWVALIELSELRPGEWTLIGGHPGLVPRPSLVGAMVGKAVAVVLRSGFSLADRWRGVALLMVC